MKPKRIILVRHGQSEADVDHTIFSRKPDSDHELTNEGHRQAHEAGRNIASLLKEDKFGVFVSPYKRTIQTKNDILLELASKPAFVFQDPRLREQDYGAFPTKEDSKSNRETRFKYGRFFYRFPGGESCADVYDRLSSFFETLHRYFQRDDCPENIIIIFHSTAIKCFLFRWYHWNVRFFEIMPSYPPNGHIIVMEKPEGSSQYAVSEPFKLYYRFYPNVFADCCIACSEASACPWVRPPVIPASFA